jgi:hypothetical protein
MTWHTQAGERILTGAEATLFRAMVDDMHRQMIDMERDDYSINLFENLTMNSQLALLCAVAQALLCKTETCPTLTAINEATIATIFALAAESVDVEIDLENDCEMDRFYWRRLIDGAYVEVVEGDEALSVESRDRAEWNQRLDALSDRILWDVDYLGGDLFLDSPPITSRPLSDDADGYFTAIAPDPRDSELYRLHEMLRALCNVNNG